MFMFTNRNKFKKKKTQQLIKPDRNLRKQQMCWLSTNSIRVQTVRCCFIMHSYHSVIAGQVRALQTIQLLRIICKCIQSNEFCGMQQFVTYPFSKGTIKYIKYQAQLNVATSANTDLIIVLFYFFFQSNNLKQTSK